MDSKLSFPETTSEDGQPTWPLCSEVPHLRPWAWHGDWAASLCERLGSSGHEWEVHSYIPSFSEIPGITFLVARSLREPSFPGSGRQSPLEDVCCLPFPAAVCPCRETLPPGDCAGLTHVCQSRLTSSGQVCTSPARANGHFLS